MLKMITFGFSSSSSGSGGSKDEFEGEGETGSDLGDPGDGGNLRDGPGCGEPDEATETGRDRGVPGSGDVRLADGLKKGLMSAKCKIK